MTLVLTFNKYVIYILLLTCVMNYKFKTLNAQIKFNNAVTPLLCLLYVVLISLFVCLLLLVTLSPLFHDLFSKGNDNRERQRHLLTEMVGRDPSMAVLGSKRLMSYSSICALGSSSSLRAEVSTCVDEGCTHDACH